MSAAKPAASASSDRPTRSATCHMVRPTRKVAPQRPSGRRTHLTGWPTRTPCQGHRLVPALRVLEARARGREIERRQGAHLDGMGVGILDLAGRVGRDPPRRGLLDDLGAHRRMESEDDALDVARRQRLEPLELEDRRLEPQQQAEIGACRAMPRRRASRPAIRRGGRWWRSPSGSAGAASAKADGTSAKPLNGGPPMNLEPVTKTIAPRER